MGPSPTNGTGDVADELSRVLTAAELQEQADALAAATDDALARWAEQLEAAAGLANPMDFEVRRVGSAARVERLAKQVRGRTAMWTTWPQTKFNDAALQVLRGALDTLASERRWMAEAHAAHRAEVAHLRDAQQALRAELDLLRTHHERSLEEHRVVMRQLALEVTEAAQLADRTRREA